MNSNIHRITVDEMFLTVQQIVFFLFTYANNIACKNT